MSRIWDEQALELSSGPIIDPRPLEARLMACPLVDQVCVVGHQLPHLVALIAPVRPAGRDARQTQRDIDAWVGQLNRELGAAERIRAWALVAELDPTGVESRVPGTPRRRLIESCCAGIIDDLYAIDHAA